MCSEKCPCYASSDGFYVYNETPEKFFAAYNRTKYNLVFKSNGTRYDALEKCEDQTGLFS